MKVALLKSSLPEAFIFTALALILAGGIGVALAFVFDDQSRESLFMPFISFVFWPVVFLPHWETLLWAPLFGVGVSGLLYTALLTVIIAGVKSIRRT